MVNRIAVSSEAQLQKIFREAQNTGDSICLYRTPSGAGQVLDFNEWNEIVSFDVDNLMVVVRPGITIGKLNEVVSQKGLRFIPGDTKYNETLSVGEWAYRGCPNLYHWKYGAGKHFVLGANYVFPNGEVASVGGRCIKNVSGYDLTRFLMGAYADIAIGTQFILKLMPLPICRKKYSVVADEVEDVISFVRELQERPVPPAWMFWADKTVAKKIQGTNEDKHQIWFEIDGNENEVDAYAAEIEKSIRLLKMKLKNEDNVLGDFSYIEQKKDEFWIIEEFKLSFLKMRDFSDFVGDVLQSFNCKGGLCGQIGDGKISLFLENKEEAVIKEIMMVSKQYVRKIGGEISGKYDRMNGIYDNEVLKRVECAIVKQTDPNQIFNR